jgi:flagellar biosynthesis protein FlhA
MTEPTFGLPAVWVAGQEKERAEVAGNTVVEAPAVIATHLMETLRTNSYKLLDRQETQRMLDHLKESHSALVEGLVPEMVSLGIIQKVLKNLLREKIPVRNLVIILETIADYASFSKDADILTEYVRAALAEVVTDIFRNEEGIVTVATLEPRLEDHVMQMVKTGSGMTQNMGFSPEQVNWLFQAIADRVEEMASYGIRPSILVSPQIRRHVRRFIETVFPNVSILSYSELTPETELKSVGMVGYPHAG